MRKLCIVLLCLLTLPAFGAITVVNNGDGTRTVQLEYTAETARVDTTLDEAAKFLYEHKRIGLVYSGDDIVDYANLTNQQKLNVVNIGVKKLLIQWARSKHVADAIDTAKDTAQNEDILIEE